MLIAIDFISYTVIGFEVAAYICFYIKNKNDVFLHKIVLPHLLKLGTKYTLENKYFKVNDGETIIKKRYTGQANRIKEYLAGINYAAGLYLLVIVINYQSCK